MYYRLNREFAAMGMSFISCSSFSKKHKHHRFFNLAIEDYDHAFRLRILC